MDVSFKDLNDLMDRN